MKFLNQAIDSTELSTGNNCRSVKQLLIDYLQDKTIDRNELKVHLAYLRYEETVKTIESEAELQKLTKSKEWSKILKTMKDGIDTAVANGSNGFNNSKYGDDYELVRVGNKLTVKSRA